MPARDRRLRAGGAWLSAWSCACVVDARGRGRACGGRARGRDRGRGRVAPRPRHSRTRQRRTLSADADDQERRDEVQPRVELVGDDELRQAERDEAEREDADRVRDGHGQPEADGVPRRAALSRRGRRRRSTCRARARARARRPRTSRSASESSDEAGAQVVARDQAREAAVGDRPHADALLEHAAREERRAARRRRCRASTPARRRVDVERALQEVLRVGEELVS